LSLDPKPTKISVDSRRANEIDADKTDFDLFCYQKAVAIPNKTALLLSTY